VSAFALDRISSTSLLASSAIGLTLTALAFPAIAQETGSAPSSGPIALPTLSVEGSGGSGYKADQPASIPGVWEAKIHPDDKERVIKLFDDSIKNKEKGVVYAEYRFQKIDGKYALVADRAFIVYDNDGSPARQKTSRHRAWPLRHLRWTLRP